MQVMITDQQDAVKPDYAKLKKISAAIMTYLELPSNSELSILLCDDDFIQKLNNEHRHIDEATDVLSFPMSEPGISKKIHVLGDVVISTETAIRQANNLKHHHMLEIISLLIHGIVHLAGYDHETDEERDQMKDLEMDVFKHLSDIKLLDDFSLFKILPLIKRIDET